MTISEAPVDDLEEGVPCSRTAMSFHAAAQRALEPDTRVRVSTSFTHLDEMLCGGLAPGRLTVLAALGGMGKSMLASAIALGVARAGGPVLFLSNQLATRALTRRMLQGIAQHLPLPSHPPEREVDPRGILAAALGRISEVPLWIDDAPVRTAGDVMARTATHGGERLIVIDGLELMLGAGEPYARERDLDALVVELRGIARWKDCPILATWRMDPPSRPPEFWADPIRRDVPPAILANADEVIVISRPAYFDPEEADHRVAWLHSIHDRWQEGRSTALLRCRQPMWFETWPPEEPLDPRPP